MTSYEREPSPVPVCQKEDQSHKRAIKKPQFQQGRISSVRTKKHNWRLPSKEHPHPQVQRERGLAEGRVTACTAEVILSSAAAHKAGIGRLLSFRNHKGCQNYAGSPSSSESSKDCKKPFEPPPPSSRARSFALAQHRLSSCINASGKS